MSVNSLCIAIIAGPSATTKMLGKMRKTNGKSSLTPALAAASSAACVRRVCELSERVCNGRAEALRLHQHGDKLPHKIDINSLRHAAPGVETRLSGTLFAANDLELLGQRG